LENNGVTNDDRTYDDKSLFFLCICIFVALTDTVQKFKTLLISKENKISEQSGFVRYISDLQLLSSLLSSSSSAPLLLSLSSSMP